MIWRGGEEELIGGHYGPPVKKDVVIMVSGQPIRSVICECQVWYLSMYDHAHCPDGKAG